MRKVVVAAVLAGLTMAGAAAAEPANVLIMQGSRAIADNQRAVPYGDIQMASIAGQRELKDRVGLAIADLCDPSRFSIAEPHDGMKCAQQAWSNVQPHLQQLTARMATR